MPTLREEDGVFSLDLGDDENRFSPDWLKTVNAALDTILSHPSPMTAGSGVLLS